MSRQFLLLAIAFLLILTFAFAQENQDSNNNKPRPPMHSGGKPPRSDEQSGSDSNKNMPPNHQNKPPKKQQDGKQQGQQGNKRPESAQDQNNDNNNRDRESNQRGRRRGFPFGMIFTFLGCLISMISLTFACGAGITFIILKKKGYSITIQKQDSHQILREEEVMPSQYITQVPVVYNTTNPIGVHYPTLQQNQQV